MDWRELTLDKENIPELAPGSVHVWRISTSAGRLDPSYFSAVLSPEEAARAARFHFEKDRCSFVMCRGTLRRLLGEYSGEDPAAIRFCYGPQGKPSLAETSLHELRFNVSHSGEVALLAFALGQEVGVDVERKRDEVDFAALAQRVFSEAEREAVVALASTARANLFYEYWSCKEACIKADGRGLSAHLDQFSVAEQPDAPQWRGVISHAPASITPDIRIRILDVGDAGIRYAAAVATSGQNWDVVQLCLAQ